MAAIKMMGSGIRYAKREMRECVFDSKWVLARNRSFNDDADIRTLMRVSCPRFLSK